MGAGIFFGLLHPPGELPDGVDKDTSCGDSEKGFQTSAKPEPQMTEDEKDIQFFKAVRDLCQKPEGATTEDGEDAASEEDDE